MTPRLEPRIARQAEVDTQCRHCSGGGACLLSGHQLPNHESPSLTSSTGGEARQSVVERCVTIRSSKRRCYATNPRPGCTAATWPESDALAERA